MLPKMLNINIDLPYLVEVPNREQLQGMRKTICNLVGDMARAARNIDNVNLNLRLQPFHHNEYNEYDHSRYQRKWSRKKRKAPKHRWNKQNYMGMKPSSISAITAFTPLIDMEDGYIADNSEVEIPKYGGRYIRIKAEQLPVENIFDESEEREYIELGEEANVQNDRTANMRILLGKLERQYLDAGTIRPNELKHLSTEFLVMFGREMMFLYHKYSKNIHRYKSRHLSRCECNLCNESLIVNNLVSRTTMSSMLTSYYHYIHSAEHSKNTQMVFNLHKGAKFNLEVLFRKLERKYYYYDEYRLDNFRLRNQGDDSQNRKRIDLLGSLHHISSEQINGMDY